MEEATIKEGKRQIIKYLRNHPYLEKDQNTTKPVEKVGQGAVKISDESYKFVESYEIDNKSSQEKNKHVPNILNSLEYALGTSTMIGTTIITRTKNANGSITLTAQLKYNLTDVFRDIYNIKYEYGKPYDMIGERKVHTYINQTFKNETEYSNYIKGLK